jgi:hypothetical protein
LSRASASRTIYMALLLLLNVPNASRGAWWWSIKKGCACAALDLGKKAREESLVARRRRETGGARTSTNRHTTHTHTPPTEPTHIHTYSSSSSNFCLSPKISAGRLGARRARPIICLARISSAIVGDHHQNAVLQLRLLRLRRPFTTTTTTTAAAGTATDSRAHAAADTAAARAKGAKFSFLGAAAQPVPFADTAAAAASTTRRGGGRASSSWGPALPRRAATAMDHGLVVVETTSVWQGRNGGRG